MSDEPRTSNAERQESDTPMTKTYLGVLVLEAFIVVALWMFGRMFS